MSTAVASTLRLPTRITAGGRSLSASYVVALRILEEANARGISFQMDKSDNMKLYCCGPKPFLVYATNSNYGWTVTRCNVLEESVEHSAGSPISISCNVTPSIPRSPYKAAMIDPLIASTIAETPMASNKVLWQILKPYGKPYCFTEAIIQGARTDARKLIFGNADQNVGYAHFVKEDLQKADTHLSIKVSSFYVC